jgi:hypothetical protein
LHGDKSDGDPHDEIVRLEEHIEELAAKIENCRKFILASRIAIAGSGVVLAALLFGAIRFDPGAMAAAVAAFLGGIVVWVSNGSTAKEAARRLPLPVVPSVTQQIMTNVTACRPRPCSCWISSKFAAVHESVHGHEADVPRCPT